MIVTVLDHTNQNKKDEINKRTKYYAEKVMRP